MSSKLTLEMLADALNTSGENAEVRVYRHAVAKLRSASLRQSMEDSTHESVMDVVQEIVWAHKPLTSAGGDSNLSSLDFTDLVAAAMPTELRPKNGATLPPKPPKKAARSPKEQLPAEDLHVLQSLVLDLREPKAQKTVFELGRRTAQRRISERIEDVQLDNGGERSISVQKLTSDEPAELTDLDRLKIRVFNFLERPKSSMAALAWFYADCILVILCVVSLVAEPLVLVVYPDDAGVVTLVKFVEWFFTILFTVELLTRWDSAQLPRAHHQHQLLRVPVDARREALQIGTAAKILSAGGSDRHGASGDLGHLPAALKRFRLRTSGLPVREPHSKRSTPQPGSSRVATVLKSKFLCIFALARGSPAFGP